MKNFIVLLSFLIFSSYLFAKNNIYSGRLSAGPDVWTCCLDWVRLNGSSQGVEDYEWVSLSGNGTFSNKNILNPKYYFSQSELNRGLATLRIYSISNPSIFDDVTIRISQPLPFLSAGPDLVLDYNQHSIQIRGSQNGISQFEWSSDGGGSFSNVNIIHPIYTPNDADKNRGFVVLKVVSKLSPTIFDEMILKIKNCNYDVTINSDKEVICGNIRGGDVFRLSGTVSHSFLNNNDFYFDWNTINGNSDFSNADSSFTQYKTSEDDFINRHVNITLTVRHKLGICPSKSIAKKLLINEPLQDVTDYSNFATNICFDTNELIFPINILGPLSNIDLQSSGTGSFQGNIYLLSEDDRYSDRLDFYFTTNDPEGPCPAINNFFSVFIEPKPTQFSISGNIDCDWNQINLESQTIYSNSNIYQDLVYWESSGNGNFAFGNTAQNNIYYMSNDDLQLDTIVIKGTSLTCAGKDYNDLTRVLKFPLNKCGDRFTRTELLNTKIQISTTGNTVFIQNGNIEIKNIQIFDSKHSNIHFERLTNKTFKLSTYTKGLYFLSCTTASGPQVLKFIIK